MVRLILAEDENISRRGLVENVEWAGNGVELTGVAENGMEAYWMAQEFAPDIIITDIRMPVMDGLELIRKLREEMPSIRFIIISAHQEFSYAQQAIQYGVDNYIIKPINDRELIENVLAIYKKSESIRKETYQKNFDYLLLKNDRAFIQQYQRLEDQLVNSFRLLQINEMIGDFTREARQILSRYRIGYQAKQPPQTSYPPGGFPFLDTYVEFTPPFSPVDRPYCAIIKSSRN